MADGLGTITAANLHINTQPCSSDVADVQGAPGYDFGGGGPGGGGQMPDMGNAANTQRFKNAVVNLQNQILNVWTLFPRGFVCQWVGTVATVPTGWAIMDGTLNAAGSGIDMTNHFVIGKNPAVGTAPDNTITGTVTHTHGGVLGAGVTGAGGGHDHGGATGSHTTGISLAKHSTTAVAAALENHTDHGHAYTDDFAEVVDAGLTDNTYDGNVTQNRHTTGVETTGGGAAAAGVLGHTGRSSSSDLDHTITDPGHTHSITAVGTHTHTITDATHLPPSISLYYIEKL